VHPPTCVVPLVGEAQALAEALADLRFGATRLVVAATDPTPRERALLERINGVEVLDVGGERAFGPLAIAGVRKLDSPVCLAENAQDVLAALREGTAGCVLVHPGDLQADVLSAARDLSSFACLLRQLTLPAASRLSALPRPLLSASLIVKDEQGSLATCLASLRGLVDEIVVCDTGSKDRTIEIAQAFGAHVVHTTWTDDFAAARNVALAASTGSWILSIDADERLVVKDKSALRRALTPRGPAALGVLIRSTTDERGSGGFEHEAVRVFRREHARWTGAVHETVMDVRTGQQPRAVRLIAIELLHDGYLNAVFAARDKAARNLALAEKDYDLVLTGHSDRPLAKVAYELARALSMHPDTQDRQESLYREALAAAPADLPRLASSIGVRLAGLLRTRDRSAEAVGVAQNAVSLTPSDPAAVLELAAALAGAGRASEAVDALDAWGQHPEAGDNEVIVRSALHVEVAIPTTRALLLAGLGRRPEALSTMEQVALAHPHHFGKWPVLLELLVLEDPTGWLTRAVALCPTDEPHLLLDHDVVLSPAARAELHAALGRAGIDAGQHTVEARTNREVDHILLAHTEQDVAAAALALEDENPALARQTWDRVPWSSTRQVALARCHLALDQIDAAFNDLDGIDPAELDVADRLTVGWLGATAGDLDLVRALLDSLPEDLGPWADSAQGLRELLPGRVGTGA
jgi:tetratricopeptide (TPR) repeat protein